MKKVIITGGAGFIGSHLCDAMLKRDYAVYAVDSFSAFYHRTIKEDNFKDANSNGAELFEVDITDSNALMQVISTVKPDVIVHLAAWAGVRPSIMNPALYAHVNVVGTQNVIDAALKNNVTKLVVASSSSVYGNNKKVPFSESDDVSNPISPYAATKVATELICKTAANLHGLPITTLRFFTVYGPRQRPDLAIRKFMSMMAGNQPIPIFGDGSTSRDYTYIDDIIDGVLRAVDKCGETDTYNCYNLGGKNPVTLKNLVKLIEKAIGIYASINQQPEQPGDVVRTWADLQRANADLGYSPRTSIETGLIKQWEWLNTDPARLLLTINSNSVFS